MKIIKTYDWLRRDFSATLKCESCNHIQEHTACYDDGYYYSSVIPNIKCDKCGESTVSAGINPENTSPKHDPNLIM